MAGVPIRATLIGHEGQARLTNASLEDYSSPSFCGLAPTTWPASTCIDQTIAGDIVRAEFAAFGLASSVYVGQWFHISTEVPKFVSISVLSAYAERSARSALRS